MSVFTRLLLVSAAVACGTFAGSAENKMSEYLTKDGKLAQTLEVSDLQGGFAGFTGRQWTVEPSGQWTVARVINKKVEVEQKGTLTKEELAELAKQLATYELAKLENKTDGKPMANPHVITIKWGKQESTLTLAAGSPVPVPDPKKPTATVESRYGGIVKAVQDLLKEKKGTEKPKE